MWNRFVSHLPVARWSDEVEHSMNTVVPEPRVTLDTGLFRENVIILSLEVAHDLREAVIRRGRQSGTLIEMMKNH